MPSAYAGGRDSILVYEQSGGEGSVLRGATVGGPCCGAAGAHRKVRKYDSLIGTGYRGGVGCPGKLARSTERGGPRGSHGGGEGWARCTWYGAASSSAGQSGAPLKGLRNGREASLKCEQVI